jgi:hypothetical protein
VFFIHEFEDGGGIEKRAALVCTTPSDTNLLLSGVVRLPYPSAMLSGIDSDARLSWSVSTPLPFGYPARIVVARARNSMAAL